MLDSAKRIFGLDLLRTIAIFSVLYGHSEPIVSSLVSHRAYSSVLFDGVSLFFVLSGFLIGGILLKTIEKDVSFSSLYDFWYRRWMRTLPNYFLVLTFLTLYYYYHHKEPPFAIHRYYSFTQNVGMLQPPFFGESWSLSIEEWFYLLVPLFIFLLIYFFKLRAKRAALASIITIIIAVTLYRLYKNSLVTIPDLSAWDLQFRRLVITRLDSLMFGVLGAYIVRYQENRIPNRRILLTAGILLLLLHKCSFYFRDNLGYGFGLYLNVFSFTLSSFATLLIILHLYTWKGAPKLISAPVTFVSITSYSMYLLNLSVVGEILIPPLAAIFPPIVRYALFYVLTFICSYLLYRFFEKPVMDLRNKKKTILLTKNSL